IPEGFNPTVGGYLYLRSLTSIPEGFNPTVGGYLYLSSLTSIPEGLGYKDVPEVEFLSWQKGKYIYCDGRFSEVVSHKKGVYKLKDVNKEKYYYLVTDGNGRFAHGDSVKEVKEDLLYKISDRDKSKYEGIDVNQKFSFTECIAMYRTITGACATGTRNFIESQGIKKKAFSVNEIIGLTKGNYGSQEFKAFFEKAQ
ncbi:MAG TPA: hypothetical protein VEA37_03145, partial [Flavobacterium sp.]|nr:hypothetical protein [Flavobacterium sp.]